MKTNLLIKVCLIFSTLALIVSILTFLRTGGVSDIKKQVSFLKKDLQDVKSQSEVRMENRSMLFDALYNLTESVDSLKSGNTFASRKLLDAALEKIVDVEKEVSGKKREHLSRIRSELEKLIPDLLSGNIKAMREFEYQIILLRIFEENL